MSEVCCHDRVRQHGTLIHRHAGHAHTVKDALKSSEISRIVVRRDAAVMNSEAWINRKSRSHGSPSIVQPADLRQRSSESEMRIGISIGLNTPTQPDGRFGIGTYLQLGQTGIMHRNVGEGIARGEPKCLVYVGLGFLAATRVVFGHTYGGVCHCQVWIQSQCPLAFSDALCRVLRKNMDHAQG